MFKVPAGKRDWSGKMTLELPNDLIAIIGTYTVPLPTYELVTMTDNLARILGYSVGFWRTKSIFERRGLVFTDVTLRKNWTWGIEPFNPWAIFYLLINKRHYGTAVILGLGDVEEIASGANSITALWDSGFGLSTNETFDYQFGDLGKLLVPRLTYIGPSVEQASSKYVDRLISVPLLENGAVVYPHGLVIGDIVDLQSLWTLNRDGDVEWVGGNIAAHHVVWSSGESIYTASGASSSGWATPTPIQFEDKPVLPELRGFTGGSGARRYYVQLDGSIRYTTSDEPHVESENQFLRPPLPAINGRVRDPDKCDVLLVDGTVRTYDHPSDTWTLSVFDPEEHVQAIVGVSGHLLAII